MEAGESRSHQKEGLGVVKHLHNRHSPLIVFKYLTFYVVLLTIFSKWTHKWIDLLFLTSLVFCGAFMLFHVHPGYLRICEDMNIDGWMLNVLDILCHLLPFVWVVWKYRGYYIKHSWNAGTAWAFVVATMYVMFGNPYLTYDADPRVGLVGMIMGGLLYAFLVGRVLG